MDELILGILRDLNTEKYRVFLSPTGQATFRYKIYPDYKANRKDLQKPVHYQVLREYLKEAHKAVQGEGIEADDLLGLNLTEWGKEAILVSIDKDLNQIPGWHYNFVNKIKYHVSKEEATKYFYIQMLMGDSSDNIPGIPGIGEKKALLAIDPLKTEQEMLELVQGMYKKHHNMEVFDRNAKVLKIYGSPTFLWEPKDEQTTCEQPITKRKRGRPRKEKSTGAA